MSVADATLPELAAQLQQLSSLHQALRWGLTHTPVWSVVDVIVQDEYTNDVIFARDGGGAGALVLDCTWLGGIEAVSVWDHRPSADELLDARVARGWTPRTSALRDGERVLGFACKLTGT